LHDRALQESLRAVFSGDWYELISGLTFTEDSSRIRQGNGPEMSADFRRLARTIWQQDTSIKRGVRGKRQVRGWDEPSLARLLAGFSKV